MIVAKTLSIGGIVGDDIEIDDAGDGGGGGIWRYGPGKVPRLISPRAGAG